MKSNFILNFFLIFLKKLRVFEKKKELFKIRFMRKRVSVKRVDLKELLDVVYERIKKKKKRKKRKTKKIQGEFNIFRICFKSSQKLIIQRFRTSIKRDKSL